MISANLLRNMLSRGRGGAREFHRSWSFLVILLSREKNCACHKAGDIQGKDSDLLACFDHLPGKHQVTYHPDLTRTAKCPRDLIISLVTASLVLIMEIQLIPNYRKKNI